MAKQGRIGRDLLREVWKRSVPRVRLYRMPRLSGRFSWLVPFLVERIPPRFLPQQLKQEALKRVLRQEESDAVTPEISGPEVGKLDLEVLPPSGFDLPEPLTAKAELMGLRGRYRILSFAGQRGLGQIYRAEQIAADRPVVIKEYWLPEHKFTPAQIRQRQGLFTQLAGLNLADGRIQDARLIHPWDAVTTAQQQRCYLVLPGQLGVLPTLRAYTLQHGPMDEAQVRHFLNQTLQTLELLHAQKYRLPSSQVVNGLAHGNLSLDSLLIAGTGQQFFIYACDFALWEYLFAPRGELTDSPTPGQDLADLGQVAMELLGRERERARERESERARANPSAHPPTCLTPPFVVYLQRLCGIAPPFPDATTARQELLRLPPLPVPAPPELWSTAGPELTPARKRWPWGWIAGILVTLLLLAVLAGLGWWRSQPSATAADNPVVQNLADVSGMPRTQGVYTFLESGSWHYAWHQPGLVAQGKTLEQVLNQQQPELELLYRPLAIESSDNTSDAVVQTIRTNRPNRVDFAVSGLVTPARPDLEALPIAYDGLAIFVPFSYDLRDQSLPAALNGRLTLAQLRQLYLGEVDSWKDLDWRLPDLPVRLYAPQNPEAIEIFEQRVMQTPSAIARFREQLATETNGIIATGPITILQTFPMLRAVLEDFEIGQTGAIAFAPLSQVVGQCSVYPLAVADAPGATPIQPLIQDDGSPISPETDLCADKGSYFPDVTLFQTQRYPLAFPLSVVFRRDNSRPPFGQRFAELFQTQEGQTLLKTTGLVPLRP